jgi:hypothetical protein
MTWPVVELDPVRRLRVLHASLPGTAVVERVIDAPFDAVWDVVGDLEGAPRFDKALRRVRIIERDGERLRVAVVMSVGLRARLDVELRPGWCWMRGVADTFVVGMAAVPLDAGRTHYAHLEGSGAPGARLLRPLFRRMAEGDVRGITREVGA